MNEIPEFPAFRRIRLGDKAYFEELLSQFNFISDYSFSNLYNWDLSGKFPSKVSKIKDSLIIKSVDITRKKYILILPGSIDEESFSTLLNEGTPMMFPLKLPEYIQKYTDKIIVEPDSINFDYIYNTEDFVLMKGGNYKMMRKKVKKFVNRNSGHKYEIFRPNNHKKKLYQEVRKIYNLWLSNKSYGDRKIEKYEFEALNKLIKHANYFDLEILKVYDNKNKLISFATLELKKHAQTGLASFLKSDKNYDGLGTYSYFLLSSHLYQLGYKYLNCEQDLGIENLRFFKNQLRPSQLLEKFLIKPK